MKLRFSQLPVYLVYFGGTMINNKEIIPFHIGIIMDGNGRWAKEIYLEAMVTKKGWILLLRSLERLQIKVLKF